MAGRLIVVSNRVPLDGQGSGGLVVALHEALVAEGEGVWIGSETGRGRAVGRVLAATTTAPPTPSSPSG